MVISYHMLSTEVLRHLLGKSLIILKTSKVLSEKIEIISKVRLGNLETKQMLPTSSHQYLTHFARFFPVSYCF